MGNRTTLSVIITLIIIALCYAFYTEFVMHLEPCPLCIAERVILAAIILPTLVFLIHNPKQAIFRWLYSVIIFAIAAFGIKTSAHHVWLTDLPPDQQPVSCGMPLGMMYQNLPINSFLHKVLAGDAECAKVNWHILGISAPMGLLLLFSAIILLTLYTLFCNQKQ